MCEWPSIAIAVEPHIVEPLYYGHLGDLVKCPVHSGTPLLWTPWRPGKVSCTVEPLLDYCGHLGDLVKCSV